MVRVTYIYMDKTTCAKVNLEIFNSFTRIHRNNSSAFFILAVSFNIQDSIETNCRKCYFYLNTIRQTAYCQIWPGEISLVFAGRI